jgi:chemotaxis protein methyltransferase CheR
MSETLTPAEFAIYRDFLYKASGFVLADNKSYLLNTRLLPVAERYNFGNLSGLSAALSKQIVDPQLRQDVVDAMTINETSFFRDTRPFDLFKTVMLPDLLKSRAATKKLRIWCAASSSGQEPYSLAMILKEEGLKLAGWNIEIVGTDICRTILGQAREGIYSQFEVQRGMPIQLLIKYFTQLNTNSWQIKQDIRDMVRYQPLNLLESFMTLGKFDLIFCRNVLIYFDEKTKTNILDRLSDQLQPDGYLMLGGAETVLGLSNRFATMPEHRGLYRPVPAGAAQASILSRAPAGTV